MIIDVIESAEALAQESATRRSWSSYTTDTLREGHSTLIGRLRRNR